MMELYLCVSQSLTSNVGQALNTKSQLPPEITHHLLVFSTCMT